MTPDEVRKKLEAGLPGAEIVVTDLTGTGDHFRAEITSASFAGKSALEQHRLVYAVLGRDVGGPIHALQLVTRAPSAAVPMERAMERVPEAEIMDGSEQAEAYALADFADVNRAFVDAFLGRFPDLTRGELVDLGCGPADIPIRIARARPELRITAIDGSRSMLSHAEKRVADEALGARIEIVLARLPGALAAGRRFDAVISNSLLHHLPDPAVLWDEMKRLAKPGAPIFVVDLMRPASPEAARAIVETHAKGERPILRSDFFNSLLAAFTIEEVEEQLGRAGLDSCLRVSRASDRHLSISGRMNPSSP